MRGWEKVDSNRVCSEGGNRKVLLGVLGHLLAMSNLHWDYKPPQELSTDDTPQQIVNEQLLSKSP